MLKVYQIPNIDYFDDVNQFCFCIINPMDKPSRLFGGVIRYSDAGAYSINSPSWGNIMYPKVFQGEAL
jgi:hypothetical protein